MVNRDVIRRLLENGEPLKSARNRAVGRTTAIALRALAEAIENPGKAIKVDDHSIEDSRYSGPTHHQNVSVLRMVADMGAKLGLEKMEYNSSYLTVTSKFSEEL